MTAVDIPTIPDGHGGAGCGATDSKPRGGGDDPPTVEPEPLPPPPPDADMPRDRSVDEDFNAFSASARSLDLAEGGGGGSSSRSLLSGQGVSGRSLLSSSGRGPSDWGLLSDRGPSGRALGGSAGRERSHQDAAAPGSGGGSQVASAPAPGATGRPDGDAGQDDNGGEGGAAPAVANDSAAASVEEEKKRRRYATPKDFELLKVIGMGAFGKVLQVRNRASGEVLAMKVISKRLLRRKTSYVENVQAERDILTKCDHPFVVTMHCSFQTREKLFIIMDFLAGGELFLRLGREGHFLERTAAFYIAEIVLALEHLHGRGILHRDLKPENILLGTDGHLCVTDFGLAKDFSTDDGWGDDDGDGGGGGRARTVCGTQEYMAPEMVARKGYGKAADFWSLGCISYEMLAGRPPFESRKGSKDLFQKIMNQRVKMPDGASASACRLLKGLLNRNAQARLGAARGDMFNVGGIAGLKQVDFFNGLDWVKLEHKEIDPPVSFDVEHDEDLRHFHDEFTNMAIPRSVKEMNKPNFQPHHCDSDMFRGFSFVHDEFTLPERPVHEDEAYWKNVDSDGQSLSECASSAFGDDIGERTAAGAPELAPVTEKKKRPPRKKKKKKAVEASAPSNLPQDKKEKATPSSSHLDTEDTTKLAPVNEKQKDDTNADASKNMAEQEPLSAGKQQKKEEDITKPKPANKPVEQSPTPKTAVQPFPVARGNVKPSTNPPPRKSSEKWETVKKGPQQGSKKGAWTPPANPTTHATTSKASRQPVPQAMPAPPVGWQQPGASSAVSGAAQGAPHGEISYRPAPGSWAAKMMSQNASSSPAERGAPVYAGYGHSKQHANRQIVSNGSHHVTTSPKNQSDWRCHSMPPSPGKNIEHRKKQPPPPAPQAGDAWPSLDDFPAPPVYGGNGRGEIRADPLAQRKAPQGSWAAKMSASQGAVKR